jgi:hypothetical protein
VIARRQPGNPIGWMMVVFTLVYVLGGAANYYAVLFYRLGHRGLPLATHLGVDPGRGTAVTR